MPLQGYHKCNISGTVLGFTPCAVLSQEQTCTHNHCNNLLKSDNIPTAQSHWQKGPGYKPRGPGALCHASI